MHLHPTLSGEPPCLCSNQLLCVLRPGRASHCATLAYNRVAVELSVWEESQ